MIRYKELVKKCKFFCNFCAVSRFLKKQTKKMHKRGRIGTCEAVCLKWLFMGVSAHFLGEFMWF
jgi:hypothetical protein